MPTYERRKARRCRPGMAYILSHDIFFAVTLTSPVGRTWPYPARLCEKMAKILPGHAISDDAVAGSDWDSWVCAVLA